MTTRTWVGGHFYTSHHFPNDAQSPANWSPTGAPQPGDYLIMVSGNMDVMSGYNLAGDELHLGNGQVNAGPVNIAIHNGGDLTVGGALNFGDPLTINVATIGNYLHADNLSAINGTVDVAANSNLVVTGKMTFAYNGQLNGEPPAVNAATGQLMPRGTITNNGDISIADGSISANINGHGTLELHNYHDGIGGQVISGSIGANQNVLLVDHDHATITELVHPGTFKASLGMDLRDPAEVGNVTLKVDGIHASRMDIRGDMLSLEGPGGRVHLAGP